MLTLPRTIERLVDERPFAEVAAPLYEALHRGGVPVDREALSALTAATRHALGAANVAFRDQVDSLPPTMELDRVTPSALAKLVDPEGTGNTTGLPELRAWKHLKRRLDVLEQLADLGTSSFHPTWAPEKVFLRPRAEGIYVHTWDPSTLGVLGVEGREFFLLSPCRALEAILGVWAQDWEWVSHVRGPTNLDGWVARALFRTDTPTPGQYKDARKVTLRALYRNLHFAGETEDMASLTIRWLHLFSRIWDFQEQLIEEFRETNRLTTYYGRPVNTSWSHKGVLIETKVIALTMNATIPETVTRAYAGRLLQDLAPHRDVRAHVALGDSLVVSWPQDTVDPEDVVETLSLSSPGPLRWHADPLRGAAISHTDNLIQNENILRI